ncbi:hypothetical protein [Thiocystis violacea]|uniref:hypothetical protein n=1 Tax=Thiocystis violacea TaxID=13725 RepID=UPI001903DC78|nr:hypothetical protein [Thiocystis violacea]MBK1721329.1 hypothetical protein [Thiocystis violacea]
MFELIALGVVKALESMDSTTVTGLFVLVMLALFGLALTGILRRRAVAFYQSTPTLLTTLGILGTFLGIAIGLLDFDSSRIEYSIPLLLNGLKLAFTTSIVGILLSACLRLVLVLGRDGRQARQPASAADESAENVNLLTLIVRQTEVADAQLTATLQLGEQVSRMDERLIQTLERQHQSHLAAMQGFAEQLSEMGSRQLIAALESVIHDFNSNLGEQFGENFRRLDGAVEKLLDWQEQYRRHMEGLGEQIDHAIEGIARSQDSLQAMTQQARQISSHVEDQEATMLALRRETMELEALLGSIAELRDKAKQAFPAIDQRLNAMLESIENAVLSGLSTQQRLGQYGMEGGAFGDARNERPARAQA